MQLTHPFFHTEQLIYLLLCYLFSIAGSALFVRMLVKNYRLAKDPTAAQMHWEGTVVGVMEACLYTTALLQHKPAFIAIWLLIKVANRFRVNPLDGKAEITEGNLFLTGTGFTILFSAVGAFMFEWLAKQEWLLAISAPVMLMMVTMGLVVYIKSKTKSSLG